MRNEDIIRQYLAELHEAIEIAQRRIARQSERGHQSHLDYADGVAAGLQQALDLLGVRVLRELEVMPTEGPSDA